MRRAISRMATVCLQSKRVQSATDFVLTDRARLGGVRMLDELSEPCFAQEGWPAPRQT